MYKERFFLDPSLSWFRNICLHHSKNSRFIRLWAEKKYVYK